MVKFYKILLFIFNEKYDSNIYLKNYKFNKFL